MDLSSNNENAVKLSVIIPVYNAEEYLRSCLDSILEQSLDEIEVICVDDGSTDSSLGILEEYRRKDGRVMVLTQENRHAGIARNNGLLHATGEYVHFLDADDEVLPYAYEALYNKLKKYDLDMIRCASLSWNVGTEVYEDVSRNSLSKLRPGDFNRLCGTEEGSPLYSVSVAPWSGLYRRNFLIEKNIQFNDLFCCNDRSFFAAVLTNSERTMISRDRLVYHRINQQDSLIGRRAGNFSCNLQSVNIIAERLRLDGIDLEVQERVLGAEFKDVCVWIKRFSGLPEFETLVKAEMEQFIADYKGRYAYLLKKEYLDALNQIKKMTGDLDAVEAKPVHAACDRPKASVVVPICNVEDYLNEALHSLTVQDMEELEFICVNDGSSDGSLTILKEYAALDKRIRILDGPNGGYGKAMNRGIDAATGDYMGILEPDDYVPHEMYRELYEKAAANDADIIKADFYRFKVNSDGSINSRKFQLGDDLTCYNRVLRPMDEPKTFRFTINTWSGIYKLDFIRKWNIRHNESPGASYQDNGFWFQTFCRAEKVLFVDKPYYMNRRDNPNSSMYSSGKMYAVTGEYNFIWDWLTKHPELLDDRIKRIFYTKKLSNFFVTLYRLRPELQQEYIRHLYEEFDGIDYRKLIDGDFIGSGDLLRFNEIMADPDGYLGHIRVSVIMPVYNSANCLEQALDSLLVRNEISFELICVDDGSTDASLDILRKYEARDPRVHVISQKNAGAGAARNAGLELARGEYLSFLDSDDFFEPDMLRRAYDRAHMTDADIVVFRSDKYHESSGKFSGMGYTIKSDLLPDEDAFPGDGISTDVFGAFVGWAWDKLFRTKFVRANKLKFQEQRTTNDMFFVFSAIVKAEKITTMNNVLAHHRTVEGSLSVTREKSWYCFYDALCELRRQLKEWGLYERREQDFINYSLHFSLWNLTTIQGPAYFQLYNKLKEEWLDDLGVLAHEMDYFYNHDEWDQLKHILSLTPEEFIFWYIEVLGRRSPTGVSQASYNLLNSKLQTTYREKAERGVEIKKLKRELSRTKNSRSYKIGRMITYIPRKIRGY